MIDHSPPDETFVPFRRGLNDRPLTAQEQHPQARSHSLEEAARGRRPDDKPDH